MIDLVHLINLDRSPGRLAEFAARHPNIPFTRFPAVEGAAFDRSAFIDSGLITADNTYTPGYIGSAASHTALWRMCAAGSKPFHIAEDDVVLHNDFAFVAEATLKTLCDWDLVLWVHNMDWPLEVRLSPGVGVCFVHYDPDGVDPGPMLAAEAPPKMLPLVTAAGIECYSLSPTGAAKLLELCLPIGAEPAELSRYHKGPWWRNTGLDVEMSRHYRSLRAYVALPMIGYASNDVSTMGGP
jgi:GR25 family glycosyltransferase involved in LPS biosynthesis